MSYNWFCLGFLAGAGLSHLVWRYWIAGPLRRAYLQLVREDAMRTAVQLGWDISHEERTVLEKGPTTESDSSTTGRGK